VRPRLRLRSAQSRRHLLAIRKPAPVAITIAPMEPIRVLRVIARLNVGGPALHVSYLTNELDRIGYETTLVAGSIGGSEGSMEYVARELGVEPVYLPALQREISPVRDLAAARALVRLIRTIRPDVLHTHTAKAGAVGRLATQLAGSARPRAVVHTYHGHVLRGYFGPAKTEAFRRLEQGLARNTDALVAVSPEVKDDLVALGVAPPEKITVIRLGLDLDARLATAPGAAAALRAELGVPPERALVGWLGRMTEIKRVDELLRAFAQLRDGGADADLLLVGDGPLRGTLESFAGELGIRDRCHFVGFRSDVGAIYAASDIVALTSANEGTPVTVIEAQAAGKPVVSTDVGGVRDVVTDGVSGFVVAPHDVDAVAERLSELAADPDLRVRLGEAGRGARDRYSVPRLVSDIDHLYRELLAPPRRARIAAPKRSLRVVLVSQYFPPEVGATQARMQSFAEHLAERGHQVTVIAEFPNHPQGVIPPEYRHRIVEDDRSNAYRVLRVWVRTSPEKTQMTRLSFYLSYMGLATAVAPLAGRADVVVATTPPLFTAVAGLAIARMNRAPFVLDVRDLWPAAATSLLQISPGWETRAAEGLEQWLYRSATAVTAVTRPFCKHVDRIRGAPPSTVLLPNGTLPQFFVDGDTGSNRLGVPDDRFLVTFAGILGIAQALPSAVEAAALLKGSADIAFVGDGPMKDTVAGLAAEKELENVHFHPQVSAEAIPPILAASDALLVPLSGHPTFEQFVPSKMIDFMATGKPVVLSAAGESARILETSGAGVVVAPESPVELASAIRWLAEHPAEAAEMGRRGREFAAGRLRSVQAERLEQLLLEVTSEE
jgi:glycosyltransferase involved in cell wall biosynthesis